MASETTTIVAYLGALAGVIGGGVALFNARKAVCWKRAELASSYMKDFNSNQELVFAGRCLDWYGGRLAVPENLRPYLEGNATFIQHDRKIFKEALRPDLTIGEMEDEPRVQLYRVAIDSFLSWLSLVSSAIDRNLFSTADIEDVGYWVAKIQSEPDVQGFIRAFGYEANINKLICAFRSGKGTYQNWWFSTGSPIFDAMLIRLGAKDWRGPYTFPSRRHHRTRK